MASRLAYDGPASSLSEYSGASRGSSPSEASLLSWSAPCTSLAPSTSSLAPSPASSFSSTSLLSASSSWCEDFASSATAGFTIAERLLMQDASSSASTLELSTWWQTRSTRAVSAPVPRASWSTLGTVPCVSCSASACGRSGKRWSVSSASRSAAEARGIRLLLVSLETSARIAPACTSSALMIASSSSAVAVGSPALRVCFSRRTCRCSSYCLAFLTAVRVLFTAWCCAGQRRSRSRAEERTSFARTLSASGSPGARAFFAILAHGRSVHALRGRPSVGAT